MRKKSPEERGLRIPPWLKELPRLTDDDRFEADSARYKTMMDDLLGGNGASVGKQGSHELAAMHDRIQDTLNSLEHGDIKPDTEAMIRELMQGVVLALDFCRFIVDGLDGSKRRRT
jgi:hypothetical protein